MSEQMIRRRNARVLQIGSVAIGGTNPIAIQSMLNTRSDDIEGSVRQAVELEKAGCQILRFAIPNQEAVALIPAISAAVKLPLVADIHFDYRLALAAADAGISKIRINPGNIGDDQRVAEVAAACRANGIPIRVGVNSGSVEKEILAKHGGPTPAALAESALYHVGLLEKFGFYDIAISLKSSGVQETIAAYRTISEQCDYPLHLGVTEAGTERMGLVKSAIGIGSLLADGIGDTIRVSLTANPVQEIAAAQDILRGLGLLEGRPTLVSCPTCGRTRIDLIGIASEVERRLADVHAPIKVAVMGCAVNGPGEAREADIGIAGGDGNAVLIKKGQIIRKIPSERIVDELFEEIAAMLAEEN
ncbi:MAG: flavodoxin-dependent (E)-4-hydroxy-3-methylbut-2-enyl-diphosphate synthase [Ruminococcaceae bacterium]|nr:flavodoxin-dependent (E)-4-hydroxy-3-methylbut-2-enyl-diphosphate synthase [Oscillospiraceae bacterium]